MKVNIGSKWGIQNVDLLANLKFRPYQSQQLQK